MEATTGPALAARRKKGRPPRIVGKRKEALLNAIRAGNHYEAACRHAKVGVSTFYRWMQLGREQESGRYRGFREEVNR